MLMAKSQRGKIHSSHIPYNTGPSGVADQKSRAFCH